MTFSPRLIGYLVASAAVLLAVLWLKACHDPAVRADARLGTSSDSLDRQLDTLQLRLAAAAAVRRRDSIALAHQAAMGAALQTSANRWRARSDSLEHAIVAVADSAVPKPIVLAALAAKDSAIGDQAGRIHTDSLRILLLSADLMRYRDTLLPSANAALVEAIRQRDAWRGAGECHVLGAGFLPRCPSRTVSYVLGGLTGLGLVVALKR
jgi:hypothetical protein